MNLHEIDFCSANNYEDFSEALDDENAEILKEAVKEIFKDEENPENLDEINSHLLNIITTYLNKLYPNKLVYTEFDDNTESTLGYVFDIPDDIIMAIKDSLECPLEEPPLKIDSSNPITKLISNWRLKE